ncbi:MAG: hypothetical protein RIT24_1853 [Planctomycetota bacterium]
MGRAIYRNRPSPLTCRPDARPEWADGASHDHPSGAARTQRQIEHGLPSPRWLGLPLDRPFCLHEWGAGCPYNRASPNEPNHLLGLNGNLTPRPLVLPCASNTDGCGTYRGRATILPAPLHTVLHSIVGHPTLSSRNRRQPDPPARLHQQPRRTRPAMTFPLLCTARLRKGLPKEFIPSSPRFRGFGTGFRQRGFAALSRSPLGQIADRTATRRIIAILFVRSPANVIGVCDSTPVHSPPGSCKGQRDLQAPKHPGSPCGPWLPKLGVRDHEA